MNTLLNKINLPSDAKAVIFHADDIGFSHSSIDAMHHLMDFGLISSASVMMPCAWAKKAIALFATRPDFCAGVHLTLTCEYDTYRWGAMSTKDAYTGLVDKYGDFQRTVVDVSRSAQPQTVAAEMIKQVQCAIDLGLHPSHIDSHMGTVFAPPFVESYLDLFEKYRLPLFIPRIGAQDLIKYGYTPEKQKSVAQLINALELRGVPVIDNMLGLELHGPFKNRFEQIKSKLLTIQPGTVTHFICHPAIDSYEMRNITPTYTHRNADYLVFKSAQLKEWLYEQQYTIISYRDIQNALVDAL